MKSPRDIIHKGLGTRICNSCGCRYKRINIGDDNVCINCGNRPEKDRRR